MSEEKNNNDKSKEEEKENIDQEELAKQWEESLKQQEESSEETSNKEEEENTNQEELAKQWEEALKQQEELSEETENHQLQEELPQNEKLELLLDIPLEISVEIGGRSLPLEDLLKLNPNTVFELDKYINEPVDIKINGKPIAKGELYTVENNFGIKIISIITVEERIKLLLEKGGEY